MCFSIISLLLVSPLALAKIDAMQLNLLESYQQGLRWDNISSAPEWLNGAKPEYKSSLAMHIVSLSPTQEVTFRLAAYQSVRLYSPYQKITPAAVSLSLSDGSGLAVQQNLSESNNAYSLLLTPQSPKPLLVHLKSAQQGKQPLQLALFVSRRVNLGEIAPYRTIIPLASERSLISSEAYEMPESYWPIVANQPEKIKLSGPIRLALRHRLQYEAQAHDLIQDYRLRYRLDDQDEISLNLSTSVDSSYAFQVNHAPAVLGRLEEAYIEVPAGEHSLELSADRNLYMQLLTQTEDDYLFPQFNQPRQSVQQVRQQKLLARQKQALAAEQSKKLAQDNRYKDAGMLASQLLKQTALERPDYPPLQQEARQLRGFNSFYRDLLANHKASSAAQYTAYFSPNPCS